MTATDLDPTVQNLLNPAPREVTGPYLPQARETLYEWVQSESLRKHCEAVSRLHALLCAPDRER